MSKCPICDSENVPARQSLCESCESQRFYQDDVREIEYRAEVKVRIEMLEKMFGSDYNSTLHDNMVEQMVRCEIAMKQYERLISNDSESANTAELLRAERTHWRQLADKLNITIRSIRGDTKNIKHDFPDDFKAYMKVMLDAVSDEVDSDDKDEDAE